MKKSMGNVNQTVWSSRVWTLLVDVCPHLLPAEPSFLPAVTVAAPSISTLSLKRVQDEQCAGNLIESISIIRVLWDYMSCLVEVCTLQVLLVLRLS